MRERGRRQMRRRRRGEIKVRIMSGDMSAECCCNRQSTLLSRFSDGGRRGGAGPMEADGLENRRKEKNKSKKRKKKTR